MLILQHRKFLKVLFETLWVSSNPVISSPHCTLQQSESRQQHPFHISVWNEDACNSRCTKGCFVKPNPNTTKPPIVHLFSRLNKQLGFEKWFGENMPEVNDPFHKYQVSRYIIIMSSHCTWVSTISLSCLQWLQRSVCRVCSQLKPCDNAIWLASCSGTTRILGRSAVWHLSSDQCHKTLLALLKITKPSHPKKTDPKCPFSGLWKIKGSKPTFRVTAMLWWTWISDQRCRSANL